MSGIDRIATERQRQKAMSGEDWTDVHDDNHRAGEMARAAACYATPPDLRESQDDLWPWDPWWWKPTPNDRIKELVKAGALIAAEIDRLERLAQ